MMEVAVKILVLAGIVGWYVLIRTWIYHYFIPKVLADGFEYKPDKLDWWFSWLVSVPITAITMLLTAAIAAFLVH